MQIDKLEIKGFGRFVDRSFFLKPGMNVVTGPNEAGKSTVMAFIRGMLFGLRGGRALKQEGMTPLQRYKPWNTQAYGGALEYTLAGGRGFRVERDFQSNRIALYDETFTERSAAFPVSRDKNLLFAEQQLGVNEFCFERTVCISQKGAGLNSQGGEELADRLSNLMHSGYEDVSAQTAMQVLREALKRNVGTERTSVRPLDRITARLEELQGGIGQLRHKRIQMGEVENLLIRAQKDRSHLESHVNGLKLRIEIQKLENAIAHELQRESVLEEMLETIQILAQEIGALHRQLYVLQQEEEMLSGFSGIDPEELDTVAVKFMQLQQAKEKAAVLQVRFDEKKSEVDSIQQRVKAFQKVELSQADVITHWKEIDELKAYVEHVRIDELSSSEQVLHKDVQKIGGFVGIALATMAAGVALLAAGVSYGWLPAAAGSAGVLFLLAYRHNKKNQMHRVEQEQNVLRKELQHYKERLADKESRMAVYLTATGARDVQHLLQMREQHMGDIVLLQQGNEEMNRLEGAIRAEEQISRRLQNEITEWLAKRDMIDWGEIPTQQHVDACRASWQRLNKVLQEKETAAMKLQAAEERKQLVRKNSMLYFSDTAMEIPFSPETLDQIHHERRLMEAHLAALREQDTHPALEGCEEAACTVLSDAATETDIAESMQQQYEAACAQLQQLYVKIAEYEVQRSSADTGDALQQMEEEAAVLQQKKQELEQLEYSLRTALEVVEESAEELQRSFSPAFNLRLSRLVSAISSERYTDVRADRQLQLAVMSPDHNNVVHLRSLSGGTEEQIYLALRIAMAEMLEMEQEPLPLLLDEVFSQYDDPRTLQALRMLQQLAESRQILLFTCKAAEAQAVRSVFGSQVNIIQLQAETE